MAGIDISRYSTLVRLAHQTGYSSLFPEHQRLALEVVPWFGPGAFRDAAPFGTWEAHGYSDFQFQPGVCQFHLGSARSVHVYGSYLKGVGVTPLYRADESNYYHGTGHLFPSAAAREFLVSEWVRKLGLFDRVIPCEGVLVSPLGQDLRRLTEQIYSNGEARLPEFREGAPECDLHLKAISIKSGPFLRFTNFNWYLQTQISDSMYKFADMCSDWNLELGLAGPDLPEDGDFSGTCGVWAARLIERLRGFFEFQKRGVVWCSVNNNFTSGLKFLDLELPIVTDPGFLFDVIRKDRWEPGAQTARIELFQVVREVRMWILECIAWCRFRSYRLGHSGSDLHHRQGGLLNDLASEMERILVHSPLFDDSYWFQFVYDSYRENLPVSQLPSLERLLRSEATLRLQASAMIESVKESVPFDARYSSELSNREVFSVPRWWLQVRGGDPGAGAHAELARLIRNVESQGDESGYLSALDYGLQEIRRLSRS